MLILCSPINANGIASLSPGFPEPWEAGPNDHPARGNPNGVTSVVEVSRECHVRLGPPDP
ncbi:hypothetical protein SAMN02745166_04824 [Prosthecobacter debontii]|uniref:Uncharacterized protein n=1 Tax=Prosthecobacter debontii TaxID=48467 RepID=A0A1T4Z1N7_9BACT|nr:hypothetical protein SAMN02745166_04824 [Prosthecobacter debontii]